MKNSKLIIVGLFAGFLLQGCESDLGKSISEKFSAITQSKTEVQVEENVEKLGEKPSNVICMVDSWQRDDVLDSCEPGERVLYTPNSWGNEQLPVRFAALYCDPRYSIALTKGAVSCVFEPANIDIMIERAVQKAVKNANKEGENK